VIGACVSKQEVGVTSTRYTNVTNPFTSREGANQTRALPARTGHTKTGIMSLMTVPDSLRSLVMASLLLVHDIELQREMITWLANSKGDNDFTELPESVAAHLSKLGLIIRGMSTETEHDHVITILGRHYLESVTKGEDLSERLEEVERLRTEFLSTVAHELRTPLTAVRTSVGLLMDPNIHADPETHQTLLESISNSADRMQHLVNDLLDLARFRSGHVHLQVQSFDGRELARAGVDAVKILTREKNQRLDVTLPKRALRVMGDRWRLEQALINLLSNASKFSPKNSTVGLSLRSGGTDVEWCVSDEGPGIDPEDMDHLFERFFTRRRDRSGSSSGTGLGLPIALAVAQAHGGTIVAESRLEKGSTFTLRVPKKHQEEPSV
jgi:signal transduction histidine kinase